METEISQIAQYVLKIGQNIRAYYDHNLSPYEIGWSQHFLIQYIYRNPGSTAQDLIDKFHVEKATISKGLKKLRIEGYILIEADEQDQRLKKLYPTEKSRDVVKGIDKIEQAFCDKVIRQINSKDLDVLGQILSKLYQATIRKEENIE